MLSKNDIKNIKSLELKKFRDEKRLFVAEGHKLVGELLGVFKCVLLVATDEWLARQGRIPADRIEAVTADELKRASLLRSPQDVLAVFCIPDERLTMKEAAAKNLVLALDDVQDPGNLGTIMRIADWFGIKDIFCSKGTADIFNPKAVQATMGAISRVKIHYTDLVKEITTLPAPVPVYGTFLDGEIIYDTKLSDNGVIIMGNEGNGISKEVGRTVNRKLYIPNWPAGAATSESLNVAIATAIVCSEFRRRCGNA
ncbi:MAG: RNA methyltransferase [Bacteroidaceae bacterium]|nr:RNA methyltransferase [Bacteroidaceae bacterium]